MVGSSHKIFDKTMRVNPGNHFSNLHLKGIPDNVDGLAALKKLDLSRSSLGRSDIQPLVDTILRHCSGLQVLNLAQNYLTDDSVVRICETLAECSPSLVSLDLSNNPLSNKAGRYLLRFMKSMTALQFVGLQKTLMNDRMLRQLIASCSKSERAAGSKSPCSPRPPAVTSHAMPLDEVDAGCGRHLSSSATGLVEGTVCAPRHEQFPTLQRLWRISAVAAPTSDDYAGLAALLPPPRGAAGGGSQCPP
ncbi:unnamed protein product [Trypanosoma congolense IL3000]|uniref:WGS project CAEQ00000000 data, annotated contig 193 n=1 Tax=Trypanosoma congolense (strain IL3000) TaxID=1068625 RepID=F9WA47_TRYCI|nr:unnamed protein product [Trypanosoma congolense IL3000]